MRAAGHSAVARMSEAISGAGAPDFPDVAFAHPGYGLTS
jgi:hypothetical protein